MSLKVVEYIREDGSNPYRKWFEGLDPQAAAKVATAAMRLGLGNTSNLKRIGTITEYRIDWGPGYRIYLAEDDGAWVLLDGGTKRRQRADIERAKALLAEYSRRKSGTRSARRKG
jgi:putative addiction module killer protein